MGTSTNQRSPDSPSWRLARAALGTLDIPPNRQLTDLWRAALADRGDTILADLSQPLIRQALRIAGTQRSPAEAMGAFDEAARQAGRASVYLDLCRRALGRAVAGGGGSTGLAAELFSELTSYYASRDLPSFVAAPTKVRGTGDAVALKSELRSAVKAEVENLGPVIPDAKRWRQLVSSLLDRLGSERPR